MTDAGMTEKLFIGVDTSCYTTSVACVCTNGVNAVKVAADERMLLSVSRGQRGLRQSDAVFLHIKNAEELIPRLFDGIDRRGIAAIGASVCPSGREGSYMPVFRVGRTLAAGMASALDIPLYGFTHQQGHIRAALYGNETLCGRAFCAFHLSGGTSELLTVNEKFVITKAGGTTDINAGQLVDRLGVRMGLGFPAGKELEALASAHFASSGAADEPLLPSSVKGLECSFSGVETRAEALLEAGTDKRAVAAAVYGCIARTLCKLMYNAFEIIGMNDFLFAGGVASSVLLKRLICARLKNDDIKLYFAGDGLSSDNAAGIALLAMDSYLDTYRDE